MSKRKLLNIIGIILALGAIVCYGAGIAKVWEAPVCICLGALLTVITVCLGRIDRKIAAEERRSASSGRGQGTEEHTDH